MAKTRLKFPRIEILGLIVVVLIYGLVSLWFLFLIAWMLLGWFHGDFAYLFALGDVALFWGKLI